MTESLYNQETNYLLGRIWRTDRSSRARGLPGRHDSSVWVDGTALLRLLPTFRAQRLLVAGCLRTLSAGLPGARSAQIVADWLEAYADDIGGAEDMEAEVDSVASQIGILVDADERAVQVSMYCANAARSVVVASGIETFGRVLGDLHRANWTWLRRPGNWTRAQVNRVLCDLLPPAAVTEMANPFWLVHRGGAVARLAEVIYHGASWEKAPLLVPALVEAGCESVELLDHLCETSHFRGCWAIETLRMWPGAVLEVLDRTSAGEARDEARPDRTTVVGRQRSDPGERYLAIGGVSAGEEEEQEVSLEDVGW